jgi:hypothetical protein
LGCSATEKVGKVQRAIKTLLQQMWNSAYTENLGYVEPDIGLTKLTLAVIGPDILKFAVVEGLQYFDFCV